MSISPSTAARLVRQAIAIVGSESKLAALVGCSQPAINKTKRRGKISAEMALAIDKATKGAVPKERMRPDLWPARGAA